MILLDTCAVVHAALAPERLGKDATAQIGRGLVNRTLVCSDITLWEIAMLISRGRIKPAAESGRFIEQTVLAFNLTVLPITPEIAVLSAEETLFRHKDPCGRIIAATALHHGLPVVTCDANLQGIEGLITVW